MEALLPIIINLVTGAVGGNVAGGLLKNLSLGTVGNSIAGIVGGGLGGQILGMLGAGGLDGVVGSLVSGGAGGGALMVIIGLVKKMLGK